MSALARNDAPGLPLAARLHARIAETGPISVEAYMEVCLSDGREGAYASRQPIGAGEDFITAPEVSQIFGELLGLWAVAVWQTMSAPGAITVVELGPGRGTLMKDALRAWRAIPKFLDSVSVGLIETSPVMAEVQRTTLREASVPLVWYPELSAVPGGPLIVLANEFIDVLPIRQFIRRDDAWHERLVTSDGRGCFTLADGPRVVPGNGTHLPQSAPGGAIFETRSATGPVLRELSRRAGNAELAALIIDYGHEESGFGDTLQAVRGHRFADPLAAPGSADLSAHVDFADLKRQASALGLKSYGPMPQGEFLLKLGLGERREHLLKGAMPAQTEAVISGAARLVDPEQMGLLFKVLALTSAPLASPPPFGPANFTLSS